MRWPFGPPHLTLKPSKTKKNPKTQKQKIEKKIRKTTKKKTKKKTKKHKNTQKELFSYQSMFSFLGVCPKFLFLTTWPKQRAPKKHFIKVLKHGVSATHFLENSFASRNGHFWTKKPKSRNSSYHFLLPSSSLSTTKTQTLAETPIFIVV